MVTGAAGSIGSEIVRQVASFNFKHLVLIDQAESDLYNLQQYFSNKNIENITAIVADVQNKQRIATIFKKYKPQIVFHAAAYKHVPLVEHNIIEVGAATLDRKLSDFAKNNKISNLLPAAKSALLNRQEGNDGKWVTNYLELKLWTYRQMV